MRDVGTQSLKLSFGCVGFDPITSASTKKRYSDTTILRYRNRNLELEPKPRIIYANYRTS